MDGDDHDFELEGVSLTHDDHDDLNDSLVSLLLAASSSLVGHTNPDDSFTEGASQSAVTIDHEEEREEEDDLGGFDLAMFGLGEAGDPEAIEEEDEEEEIVGRDEIAGSDLGEDDDGEGAEENEEEEEEKEVAADLLRMKEIGKLATWTVSSFKQGFGVDKLMDDAIDTYWQ